MKHQGTMPTEHASGSQKRKKAERPAFKRSSLPVQQALLQTRPQRPADNLPIQCASHVRCCASACGPPLLQSSSHAVALHRSLQLSFSSLPVSGRRQSMPFQSCASLGEKLCWRIICRDEIYTPLRPPKSCPMLPGLKPQPRLTRFSL